MLLEVNTQNPEKRKIKQQAELLRDGGIVIYPTDTTYAFGCDMYNKHGVEKILAIKRMPRNKLLSLVCGDLKEASQYGFLENSSYKIMKRCLPGPYTFILKATKLVPRIMVTKRKTIGIRIPDNRIALDLVEELGHPIITASVRLEGEEIMGEPWDMHERLGHLVDSVLDAGIILPYESSVVDLSGDSPEVIREGKGDLDFINDL